MIHLLVTCKINFADQLIIRAFLMALSLPHACQSSYCLPINKSIQYSKIEPKPCCNCCGEHSNL